MTKQNIVSNLPPKFSIMKYFNLTGKDNNYAVLKAFSNNYFLKNAAVIAKTFLLALVLSFGASQSVLAQTCCSNPTAFVTVGAPAPGNSVQISTCTYAGEYNTVTGLVAGRRYSAASSAADWLTVRHTSAGGTIVYCGPANNAIWQAPVSGTYFLHFNLLTYVNGPAPVCGTQSSCRTTTFTSYCSGATTTTGYEIAQETNPVFTAAAACSNGSIRVGAGSWRDITLAANTYYNWSAPASFGSNGNQMRIRPLNGGATTVVLNAGQSQNSWFSGTTTTVRVSVNRTTCIWSGTSNILTYRHTQPNAGTITQSPASGGTICAGQNVQYTSSGSSNGNFAAFQFQWNSTAGSYSGDWIGTNPGNWTSSINGNSVLYVRSRVDNNGCSSYAGPVSVQVLSTANNPGAISVPASICAGTATNITNVTAATTGTPASSGPNYYFYYRGGPSNVGWQMFNGPTSSSTVALPAAVINTPGQWYVARNSEFGCAGQANNSTTVDIPILVVPQTTAPTSVSKSPNIASVCAGTVVSVSSPTGGEAGLGCTIQYQFLRGATVVQAWSTTASYTTQAADAGNDINVQVRRTSCTTGCNTATSGTLATWSVVAQPTPFTSVSKSPNVASVCTGTVLTASSPSGGNSGIGCITQYQFLRGATVVQAWSTTASYTTVLADAGNTINVQVRKTSCQAGCNDAASGNLASWSVVAQPTAPTAVTKTPNVSSVCTGTVLTASAPTGGNPGTGCQFEYRFQRGTTTVQNWSTTNTYTTQIDDNGNTINVQVRRANCVAGCNVAESGTLASWATDQLVLSTSSTNSGCNVATGSATVTLTNPTTSGGNATSFTWSSGTPVNGTNTSTINNVASDNYSVTVSNALGCSQVTVVSVTDAAGPSANISAQTNLQCFGATNGSASVTISGGTPPYNLSWLNGLNQNGVPAGTYPNPGLSAGLISVNVTDANNCNASASTTITQPSQLVATVSGTTNVSCFGGNNGAISLNVTGGTGGRTYTWSGPGSASGQNPTGLLAGNYNVTVQDANGCTATLSNINISQPAAALNATASSSSVSCFGGSNGAISLTVTGGTGAKTFAWSGPATATGQNPGGLITGNYNVTITDANNCTFSLPNINVSQPTDVVLTVSSKTNVDCKGNSTGSVTLSATGGVGGYTYSNNGTTFQASPTFSGLAAGNYAFYVRDANLCQKSILVDITEPLNILASSVSNIVNANCFGASTGELALSVSGGTSPYSFNWSGPSAATGQNPTGLAAGSYAVTVTDANLCTVSTTANVGQAALLTATVTPVPVTVCIGNTNGEINFTSPSGGSGSYQYSIDGGNGYQSVSSFTGLAAGSYAAYIRDANVQSCEVSLGTITVNDAPDLPAPVFPGGNNYTTCGLIIINATPGAGADNVRLYDGPPATASLISEGTSFVLRNLPAGNYTYYATSFASSVNCESNATTIINIQVISPLLLSGSRSEVTCFGAQDGAVDLIPTGATPPYNYSWSNGATTQDLNNLSGGVYTVTVTGSNGCLNIETFNVTEYAPLNVVLDAVSENGFNVRECTPQTSAVTTFATGGKQDAFGNYSYLWSDASTSLFRDNLLTGNYSVTVTDDNGCSVAKSIQMIAPPAISITTLESYECAGGGGYTSATITVIAAGGLTPFTYSLDGVNYQTSNEFNGLADGSSHTIYVKDNADCVETTNVTVNFPPANVPVGDCDFIYVAPESQGGNALNLGTPDCPTTLPAAVSYVTSGRNYIRLLQGTYTYNVPVDIPSNVVIEGGYQIISNDWVKSTGVSVLNFEESYLNPAIGVGHYVGFISTNKTNWRLKDLDINVQLAGAVGQQDGRGKSVYGILINNNSSNYKLSNVNISTGNASNGANGALGVNGLVGLNGVSGNPGEFIVGGPPNCCNGTFGLGGNGVNGVGAASGLGQGSTDYQTNGSTQKVQPRGSNNVRSSGAGGVGGHGGGTLNTTPLVGRNSGVGGNGGFNGSIHDAIGANVANGSGTLVWDFYNQPQPSPVAQGTSGSNGEDGSNASLSFAPGNLPSAFVLSNYFVPGNGANGGDGFGGAGGSGGGGAGSAIVNGSNGSPAFIHVLRGSGGGSGGSGGEGGQGGRGGNGGGANFGIFVASNSTSGATFQSVNINTLGAAGNGGSGGQGGIGGIGGSGGQGGPLVQDNVNNVILLSPAGNGGNGGKGGNGGRGQDGDNGLAQDIYFGGNTPPAQSVAPSNGIVSITGGAKGCTNSVISISKTSSDNWGLSGANFVNDLTNTTTSYTISSNTAEIFYTSTGWKNINVGATTLNDFIFIRQSRPLPVITSTFTSICVGGTVNLSTSTIGEEYLWEVALVSNPSSPIFTYNTKDVFNVTMNTAGIYQVKLQVKESCCGWSVPVYRSLTVNPLPSNITAINGPTSVCVGETAIYSVDFVSNAAPSTNSTTGYKWLLPPGATVTSAGGLNGVNGATSNSITVTFGSSSGSVFVTPSNTCGNGQTLSKSVNIKPSPTGIVFSGTQTICNGETTQITAVAQGGIGGYAYAWSNGANTNIINVSPAVTTTYSVTATASNACSISSSYTVTVIPIPNAPVLKAPTAINSTGFTANWNAVANATNYYIDVATDNAFANILPGYNNVNVGNVLFYTVSGLNPSQTYYYRVRSATGTCISPNSTTGSVTIQGLVWTGNIDTDWFKPGNWSGNVVPNASNDVLIPVVPSNNYPVLVGLVTALSKNLTVNSGASLEIQTNAVVEVNGSFVSNSSMLQMGEGSLLLKGSETRGSYTIGTLVVESPGVLAVGTSVSVINITEKFELNSGVFNNSIGANVILKSTPTRTAYVDDFDDVTGVTNSGTGIVGDISIERYVPFVASGSAPYIYLNRYHYIGALTGGNASKWTAGQFKLQVQGSIIDGVTTITPTPDCSETTLATGTAFSNLFTYNESKVTDCYLQGWEPRLSSATTPRGRGFAARINDASILIVPNRTLSERGVYSNTDLTLNGLTITGTNLIDTTRGWHIVANPFWAPIDWTKVTGSNLDATAYRYDPETGNFLPINNIALFGKTLSTNEAVYIRPLNNNTPGTYSITFPATARTNTDNNEFLRQQQPYLYGLKINVEANNESDKTFVLFDTNFTDGYDNGYDAGKMNSSVGVPTVYTRDLASNRSSILALPEVTQQTTIPLGVRVQFDGQHVFTFEGVEDFPNTSIIWLEDLQTGAIQYLRDNNVYSFTANINDNADRFLLHFAPEMLIVATDANCDNENGSVNITERGGLEWIYTVTDATNNTITNGSVNGGQETVSQLPSGTYTLQFTNTISGYQTTETVTVNQVATVSAAISTQATQVNVGDVVTVDISNTTGATNTSVDMGDGTVYNNESIINHSYNIGGNYTITVNANNDNCTDAASLQIMVMDVTTNIADAMSDASINVTANRNELYIEQLIEKGTINAKVEIYNMLGQIVMITDINATYKQPYTIVLEDVARGTYIARVTAKGKMVSKRLLVSE